MEVRLHDTLDEFRPLAEQVYRRDPVRHTFELGVLAAPPAADGLLMVTVWTGSDLVGAALRSPGYPFLVSGLPSTAIPEVAETLTAVGPEIAAVHGLRDTAITFGHSWAASTGATAAIAVDERLYRLATLHPPADVPGTATMATTDDIDLLAAWFDEFQVEAFARAPSGLEKLRIVIDRMMAGGDAFVFWRVSDTPVAFAVPRRARFGVSRIGPVYTPRERRGRGYGSAVTAAAAQLALDRGATEAVLFTDLANEVSNSIYQRIGFEPVADYVEIAVTPLQRP
ncbi:GNAT family N-acetyltransferase [Aldersonia sp. NBC_00410]|uniref:GNAT family N-acetyltransferase n=1 Tax=Aldersonia sp. NBC_00410 TaxID=2975954 RepID=UPI00225355D3|nr:GNAT family N-acetyltransferase [Aldersonia sp. NBC_00410]MCX5044862.1 GNAT family N-acetyltransferase [Aldersonia sp. NBC_00410]